MNVQSTQAGLYRLIFIPFLSYIPPLSFPPPLSDIFPAFLSVPCLFIPRTPHFLNTLLSSQVLYFQFCFLGVVILLSL